MNWFNNTPTPALLRKCAEELWLHKARGQVSFTSGGAVLRNYFHDFANTGGGSIDSPWSLGKTDEKAMLCLFFAEFLEGEPK